MARDVVPPLKLPDLPVGAVTATPQEASASSVKDVLKGLKVDDLRERAAVQVLASLMQYYHSVDDNTIAHAARMAWLCADALVASRDLPTAQLKPKLDTFEAEGVPEAVEASKQKPGPAHPNDEWWVYLLGGRTTK